VAVCDHRYVFNPILVDNDLDANAPCPPGIDSRVAAAESQSAASAEDTSKPVASEEPITRETESVFSPQRIRAILDGGYKPRSETQY
jgi:hypothetical protein